MKMTTNERPTYPFRISNAGSRFEEFCYPKQRRLSWPEIEASFNNDLPCSASPRWATALNDQSLLSGTAKDGGLDYITSAMFPEQGFYSEVGCRVTDALCFPEESTSSNESNTCSYIDSDVSKGHGAVASNYTPPPHGQKPRYNLPEEPSSSAERRRRSHTIVEKRYRESLNRKFIKLGKALKKSLEQECRSHNVENETTGRYKRAEILNDATERILELQEEVVSLKTKLQTLREATIPVEICRYTLP